MNLIALPAWPTSISMSQVTENDREKGDVENRHGPGIESALRPSQWDCRNQATSVLLARSSRRYPRLTAVLIAAAAACRGLTGPEESPRASAAIAPAFAPGARVLASVPVDNV